MFLVARLIAAAKTVAIATQATLPTTPSPPSEPRPAHATVYTVRNSTPAHAKGPRPRTTSTTMSVPMAAIHHVAEPGPRPSTRTGAAITGITMAVAREKQAVQTGRTLPGTNSARPVAAAYRTMHAMIGATWSTRGSVAAARTRW